MPLLSYQDQAIPILRNHKLRRTDCRVAVLKYFLAYTHAITHSELEKVLTSFDRVTLYRTLSTFLEKGLIHKVLDAGGITKYALCSEKCAMHQHSDQHVHFNCVKCGLTECLDHVAIPTIQLPTGYQSLESNFLVQGVCKSCNA